MPQRVAGFGVLKYRMLAFLAVFGPGFITANVDNDPGGILTYSQAGAKLGYVLLWTLIPTTIALIVVQEMAARMGAVTGKGLADLIREEFGLRATFFMMVVLGIADFGNIMAEFAGLASGMGIFGVSKYLVRAGGRGAGLVCDGARIVQAGGAHPDFVFADLFHLSRLRDSGPSGLDSGGQRYVCSAHQPSVRLHCADRGIDRHHHYAVDAVLSAGFHRGKRHHASASTRFPAGTWSWAALSRT